MGQPEELAFGALVVRLRAGDADAAAQLVRQYEPEVRRVIRFRLQSPQLRRTLDSLDVVQSVLGNFFVRAAAGEFELQRPEQLLAVLLTMARNRVIDKVRHEQAACRDQRRRQGEGGSALRQVAAPGETPSQLVASRELLQRAYELLTDEERCLAELRRQGRDWAQIATQVGGTADAVRKKLSRAMDRVAIRLGLDVAHTP
jgi:RNA polymerase sigma factor (sigma-70 family)